jgi:prevent-host-death family protein
MTKKGKQALTSEVRAPVNRFKATHSCRCKHQKESDHHGGSSEREPVTRLRPAAAGLRRGRQVTRSERADFRWAHERECGKLSEFMKAATAAVDYVVKNGKRTAVILPIDEYEELLQDLDDLAVIARRKNEPTIPLAEVKRV